MKHLLIALLLGASLHALADDVFISDVLYVQLRSEGCNNCKILKALKSGTPLQRLAVNDETGFTQVETADGTIGWVPTQYVSEEETAQLKLNDVSAQLQRLQAINQRTSGNVSVLEKAKSDLETANQVLTQENQQLSKELQGIKKISANAINLDKTNKALREDNEALRNQVEVLSADNSRLRSDDENRMLMIGGGLVLLGMLLAVVLPRMMPKKKSDGWN